MKNRKSIPVFCFDEHNQAYYYWHRARIEGHLNQALDLVHIDAHADMGQPPAFSESLYARNQDSEESLAFYHRFAANQLSNNDFILPAILSGLVRNVYFTYPKWRKFKPIRKRYTICSAFGEGKVLKYGIRADRSKNPMIHKAFPDLTRFQYASGEVRHLPRYRKVLLDIDLDYFACRDSITNQMSYELEITRNQHKQRERFLSDKTFPFSGLQIEFIKRNDRFFARIERKKIPERVHLPPEDVLEKEIDTLVSVLVQKKIRPALVTICRSCDSGYCPRGKAEFIEPLLINKIQPLIL